MSRISHLKGSSHIICLVGAGGVGKKVKGLILTEVGVAPMYRFEMSELINGHRSHPESAIGKMLVGSEDVQSKGGLVNDAPVICLFEDACIMGHHSGANWLLGDGFPRSVGQAKYLLQCGVPYTLIYLEADKNTSLKRIRLRAELTGGRSDDSAAPDRYQTFMKETLPAIRMLKRTNPNSVIRVDATAPLREQITRILRFVILRSNMHKPKMALQLAMKRLDNPRHPAAMMIRDVESGKPIGQHVPARSVRPQSHPMEHVHMPLGVQSKPVEQSAMAMA